jgi:hypothetical protein
MPALSREVSRVKDEKTELAVEEGIDADLLLNSTYSREAETANRPRLEAKTRSHVDIEKEAGTTTPSTARSASINNAYPPGSEARDEQEDPYVVWWDGPDDPTNPMNWSMKKKWGTIAVVSGITFLSPLGSSVIAPGVPLLMDEFGSSVRINFFFAEAY